MGGYSLPHEVKGIESEEFAIEFGRGKIVVRDPIQEFANRIVPELEKGVNPSVRRGDL